MNKTYPRGKASVPIGYTNPMEGLREPGRNVWLLWIASYAFGGTLGSLLSSILIEQFSQGSDTLAQILAGLAGTFLWGAILGMANWLALRPYLKDALWWPVLTGVGLMLGSRLAVIAFQFILPQPAGGDTSAQVSLLNDAANGAVIGVMIGLAQAALLARRVSDRGGLITFVVTSGLGWLGLVLLDSLLLSMISGLADPGPVLQIGILLLGFALAGAISGFELPSLLKKHQQQLVEQASNVYNPAAGTD
jgi:hypothetical protein